MAVHRLFEQQAARTPHATAVVFGDLQVSYQELNRRATAVANALRDQGAGPNTLVGLMADRSVEMVAGILAILKAGAAYVPLDPTYPVQRLAFIARDAGLELVLAAPKWEDQATHLGASVLPFSSGMEERTSPQPELAPQDPAYVMYTSGSSGQPKGVVVPHAGLLPLLEFTQQHMRIGPHDRVLQFASFSFDVSVWEIFVTLISGATLVLAKREDLMPGPSLHGLICRHGVTIAVLSPSVLQVLPPEGLNTLRMVVATSEKLTGDIIARWHRPGRRFINAYGPTEATIWQTIWGHLRRGRFPTLLLLVNQPRASKSTCWEKTACPCQIEKVVNYV